MNAETAILKLRDAVRRKHLAWKTERSYTQWLRRYCAYLSSHGAPGDSTSNVSAFLTSLAKSGCSASTQNQALQALLMFYREVVGSELGRVNALRAKRPQHIRYAPSREETARLLRLVQDSGGYPIRLIVHMLYGCGLRVGEPLNVRLKDVDLVNGLLTIRSGKGEKDRVVNIPRNLSEPIRRQMAVARALWEQDAAARIPVPLPSRLAQKAPSYAFAFGWYWLFPAKDTCRHPRTGEIVRYRVLETNVQRAVRTAAAECGLAGIVTPHCFRHAYGTHAMQSGVYVRDVQVIMGHKSLETTMGYLHAEAKRVNSPIETLEVALT